MPQLVAEPSQGIQQAASAALRRITLAERQELLNQLPSRLQRERREAIEVTPCSHVLCSAAEQLVRGQPRREDISRRDLDLQIDRPRKDVDQLVAFHAQQEQLLMKLEQERIRISAQPQGPLSIKRTYPPPTRDPR